MVLYHRYQGTVQDGEGNVVPNANLEVCRAVSGLPLAALKSNLAGTSSLSNPFTADSEGYFYFYARDDIYQVRSYLGAPLSPTFERVWPDVEIGVMAGYRPRIGIIGGKTFYWRIDGDGDDDLDGETEDTAKATVQALHDYVFENYMRVSGVITLKCIGAGANLTTQFLVTSNGIIGVGHPSQYVIEGSAVEVYEYKPNNADVITLGGLLSGDVIVTVCGFRFATTGSFGNCINAAGGACTIVYGVTGMEIDFGPCVQSHVTAAHNCNAYPGTKNKISGGAIIHENAQSGATVAPHGTGYTFVGSANSLSFPGGFWNCESEATLHVGSMTGGAASVNTAAVNTSSPMGIVTGGMIKNYPTPTTLFANGIVSSYGSGRYLETGLEPLPIHQGGTGATASGGSALDNVSGFSSTGHVVRTAAATYAMRTLTGPAAGITVTNGSGVSGNPTLALANDLAAIEALSSTGYPRRTGTDTWTQDAPGQLAATATNDDASAGKLGEYVSSNVASGSAVGLTTATPANVTSIILTAGDWEVEFHAAFTGGGTTVVNYVVASISTSSATLDNTLGRMKSMPFPATAVFNNVPGGLFGFGKIKVRLSLSGTTTVYAVAQASFTTSTCSAYGLLAARRVR